MRHRAIQRWLFTTKDKRPLANVGRDRSQPVGLYRNRLRPKSLKEHVLIAQRIDSNNFKSYGQVTRWEEDGKQYDEQDLKLEICQGSPRLYIFRARDRDLSFDKITYHEKVTQCLFRIGNHPWFLAVAKPTFCVKQFPSSDDIEVFQIEGDLMVKLNAGVWHAGPLFDVCQLSSLL